MGGRAAESPHSCLPVNDHKRGCVKSCIHVVANECRRRCSCGWLGGSDGTDVAGLDCLVPGQFGQCLVGGGRASEASRMLFGACFGRQACSWTAPSDPHWTLHGCQVDFLLFDGVIPHGRIPCSRRCRHHGNPCHRQAGKMEEGKSGRVWATCELPLGPRLVDGILLSIPRVGDLCGRTKPSGLSGCGKHRLSQSRSSRPRGLPEPRAGDPCFYPLGRPNSVDEE
mmetsp:Transcript_90877/g.189990  ORF Transcript_90877/g.189990 Transcript_90877/m.189990 type:complete len:225 (+) Transcript_90877:1978-2652(+)